MIPDSIVLEPDGRGSYTFTFSSERGEVSGRVTVGTEGPPERRSKADQEQAAKIESWRSHENSARPAGIDDPKTCNC